MAHSGSTRAPAAAHPQSFPAYLHHADNDAFVRRLTRSSSVMAWARQQSYGDDLEQLAIMEVAKFLPSYDPAFGTSVEQFIGSVLPRRLVSCQRMLIAMHGREVHHLENDSIDEADECGCGSDRQLISFADGLHHLEDSRRVRALLTSIERLPERQRQVVELMLDGHTESEITEIVGVSVQSINKSKLAAIASLRASLANHMQ